jgi:AcrR family transcriptional regulator|tara:strand:- start:224 stop:859 length:636 start_codon:yes stop_codon:yes gene_type:complete
VARDGTETRARLLAEAESQFAEVGIWQAAVGDIVRAAGQRNASALTYHFGSREGVLDAILAEHGNPIDVHRGELISAIQDDPATPADLRSLVSALVRPMTTVLADPRGRRYVRIVAQLSDRFPAWQDAPEGIHQAHLTEALSRLEALAHGPSATIRNARLVAMIRLMTSSLAARAVALDSRSTPALDDPTYEGNLVDVLVGVLTAPSSLVA